MDFYEQQLLFNVGPPACLPAGQTHQAEKNINNSIILMYDFETTDFALSNKGIHFLRNRYNYKTIDYQEIEKAIAKRGLEMNNILITLLLGIILVAFAVKQSLYVIHQFRDPTVHQIFIESIILPILPGLLGIYLIWNSTRIGPVLLIETKRSKHKLRLKQFTKTNKTKDLTDYLQEKLSYRFVIQDIL